MKKIALAAFLTTALVPAAFAQTATTPATPGATTTEQGGAMGTTGAAGNNGAMGTNSMGAAGSSTMNDASDNNQQAAAPAQEGPFVTVAENGIQRLSDLQGEDVYSQGGDDIGEVNDVLIGQDGRVAAVVIGVGGFLGIGEKDVAVSMDSLQLPTNVDTSTTASTSTAGTAGTMGTTTGAGTAATGGAATGTDMAANTNQAASNDDMSNRIVLNVTREQLEQAPAYQGTAAEANN